MAESVRVVSYNVRYFSQPLRGLAGTRVAQRRIAERLASLRPRADVICLQEVEGNSLRAQPLAWRRPRGESQLDGLLAELELASGARGADFPYQGFFFPADAAKAGPITVASGGLGILVDRRRFRVVSDNTVAPHCITGTRVDPLRGRRSCGHVQLVDGDGSSLHVFNTHLSLPLPLPQVLFFRLPWRLGYARNQLEEARALTQYVALRSRGEPFVLCGDFNATPGSPVIRHIVESGFRPACLSESPGSRKLVRPATFAAGGIALHLDHLFCGGGAAWVDAEGSFPVGARGAPFTGLSDHAPVIARLNLTRDPAIGRPSTTSPVASACGTTERRLSVPVPTVHSRNNP